MKFVYTLIVTFFYLNMVSAQHTFINYSSRNGLSSNTINAILKDRYGFMWFGTDDGLNRFDGQTFKNYRHKDLDSTSLQRGSVIALTMNQKGQIWIATTSTLSLYNPKTDAFINYDFNRYGWILSIFADHSNNIWVGTYNGVFIFNPETGKAQQQNLIHGITGNIHCITEDKQKNIWIGTDYGLVNFNTKTSKQKVYSTQSSHIASNRIRSIIESPSGEIWIGTSQGLNVLSSGTFKKIAHDPFDIHSLGGQVINTLAFESKDILWVGTDKGVDILNVPSGKVTRLDNSPANQNGVATRGRAVRKVYVDNNGLCWIATHQGGINKYDPNLAYFSHTALSTLNPYGLTAGSVVALEEAPSGQIFIGTEGGGLNILDRNTNRISSYSINIPKLNTASVIALSSIDNALWLATYQYGLYRLDISSRKATPVSIPKSKTDPTEVPVNCIKQDRNGNIWLGTNGGGLRIQTPSNLKTSFLDDVFQLDNRNKFPLNTYITALEEDHAGNIWIGSNGNGIAVFNPVSKTFLHLNRSNSNLPMDKVQSILADSKGRIWVGVSDGGLCLYLPNEQQFKSYDENYFLANGVIHKILEDKNGKIWVSTNKGISSFDPENKLFRNFTKYNGVQQSTFNIGAGLKAKDGELFFGGLDGFNHFYPSAIVQKKNVPPLVITDLRVNNKHIIPFENAEIEEPIIDSKQITLQFKQNFALDFMALNMTSPHENRYAYKLDGFDKEWSQMNETNTATYTNLDPGKYIFRLKACSEDGAWTTPEKTIAITVKPPFWQTYYAYLFYFVTVAALLWAIKRRSIQKLKNEFLREQEKLEIKHLIEKERQKAEQKTELEKVKIKFLTNLSHELKTPLTLVLNPIENLMFHEQNPEKLEMLNLIGRNGKRLLNLVNQLLDFKKIESNELNLNLSEADLIAFSQDIFDSFKYISVRKNISFHFTTAFTSYITKFDKDKLERILINLLSNAIKFTNEGGNITFKIQGEEKGIKLILRDTGIGLPENMQEKIFERFFQANAPAEILNQGSGIGLSIAQEFVHLHGGTISLNSQEGIGSTFTIELPLLPLSFALTEAPIVTEQGEITRFALQKPPVFDLPSILIIDDDDDLRAYLVESLKTKYKVIEASNGKEGWQKTLAFHPQIIISDVDMPIINGIEMLQKLKNDKRTKHIPVIMLTVLADDENQLKGLETGASDYLIKPFSFNLLNIKIENLLSLSNDLKSTYKKQISLVTPATEIVNEDEKFLYNINKYIENHVEEPDLSIEALSKAMCVSRSTLYSKVLELTGETPVEYIRTQKLNKAVKLLEKSDMKISQIAYSVGFSNPNYFARAFRAKYNLSPSEYINQRKKST